MVKTDQSSEKFSCLMLVIGFNLDTRLNKLEMNEKILKGRKTQSKVEKRGENMMAGLGLAYFFQRANHKAWCNTQ